MNPLVIAVAAVVLVVLLTTWVRMPAFVSLTVGAVLVGVAARMPVGEIARAFQSGIGDTLGFVAMVIALGTVIGKLLAESGGAAVVAAAIVRAFGERRLTWAMLVAALVIGLPVFFQVGLVLLAPILFTLVRDAGQPLLRLAIPLTAGLSVMHGLTPPHPGPLAAIERLNADTGRTLLYGVIVGIPVAILAGPVFGALIGRRIDVRPGGIAEQLTGDRVGAVRDSGQSCTKQHLTPRVPRAPRLGVALLTLLLPVGLMLVMPPLIAMLAATVVALYALGIGCGFGRVRLLQFAEESLLPIASVLLVVGAGGGFGRLLDAAGVDTAIADAVSGFRLSPLVLGWTIAALLRLSVGSATVACVTAASIVAPIVAGMADVNRELLVVSIGAGSLIASHVNDGGFWLVKEYLNMSVQQTVVTWTLMETIVAFAGLAAVLLLALAVG